MEGDIPATFSHMNPSKPPLIPTNSVFQAQMRVVNTPTNGALWGATTNVDDFGAKFNQTEPSRVNLGLNCDQNMDPKKIRKLMLKRLASKRSRLRKKMYEANLEMKVREIEAQIVELKSQLEIQPNHKRLLVLEQELLTHRINIVEQEMFLKEAVTEELMAQTNVLNELYAMQYEPQEQMLDWNINNNVEPISYDPMENYYSNPYNQDTELPLQSQMLTPTLPRDEYETNVIDQPNNKSMGMMEIKWHPHFNNDQFI